MFFNWVLVGSVVGEKGGFILIEILISLLILYLCISLLNGFLRVQL